MASCVALYELLDLALGRNLTLTQSNLNPNYFPNANPNSNSKPNPDPNPNANPNPNPNSLEKMRATSSHCRSLSLVWK